MIIEEIPFKTRLLSKTDYPIKTGIKKPQCLIMGGSGVGKTTLKNKICKTKYATGFGRHAVTRNLTVEDACEGMYSFSLIDTPGTDSKEDTYKHAYFLREALTCTPLNAIFIVVKF